MPAVSCKFDNIFLIDLGCSEIPATRYDAFMSIDIAKRLHSTQCKQWYVEQWPRPVGDHTPISYTMSGPHLVKKPNRREVVTIVC